MKRLALALLACGLVEARADTIGPAPGNALNPTPANPTTAGRWLDEEGLGTRIPAARTPTGMLYNVPLDPGPDATERDRKAWTTTSFMEIGGVNVSGKTQAWGFRNYKELRNGAYLDLFTLAAEKPDEARYLEITGGAPGLRDQFYRVQAGRYNDWRITAFYEGTPQTFTTTYRYPNGVTPGGTGNANTTQANIQNALAKSELATLEIERRRAGVEIDKRLGERWRAFASFTSEKREGTRPFGAVFGGGGGGGNVEITESVDYETHDMVAGLQFADPLSSFNVRASASFFHNSVDTMRFQNPLFVTLNGTSGLSPTLFTAGRFDLAPDNAHFNLKGEYARTFPSLWRGYFTATVAAGTMRQNENLIAPTEYALTGGTVTAGGASLANQWNTPAALSQQTADARIDTLLADFAFAFKPAMALDVKAKVRLYETDNSMQYLACNPLTGQWGRLLNDGTGLSLVLANTTTGANPSGTSANAFNAGRCDLEATRGLNLVPAAGNVPVASMPADYRQVNASVAADYRLRPSSSVNAAIEREDFRRDWRERSRTWEDRIKVGYVERGLFEGTMRVSYEYGRRSGSDYNSNPYDPFYSASFGPDPAANGVAVQSWFHSIEQFRSFDIADRRQNVLNARVNHSFLPTVDTAITVQLKDAEYPSAYGRTGHQRTNSVTFDAAYQAGSRGELYGFFSLQTGALDQRGVHPNQCVIGTTYYFYSDGEVLSANTGAAAPAAPAGTTLVATRAVTGSNWRDLCGEASPTSPLFPESRAWEVRSRDNNRVLGLGFKYDFGKAKLDGNLARTFGRTRIGYSYNAAALGMSALQAALAGDGLADLVFVQTVANVSLAVPLQKDVALRFLLRREVGKIRDWHYDGVAANPMPANNALYLDGGPQDWRATVFGVFVQMRM